MVPRNSVVPCLECTREKDGVIPYRTTCLRPWGKARGTKSISHSARTWVDQEDNISYPYHSVREKKNNRFGIDTNNETVRTFPDIYSGALKRARVRRTIPPRAPVARRTRRRSRKLSLLSITALPLSCLLEEPGELSPVVPLHPCGDAVVEAVHAHVLVVVPTEDLRHQEAVGKVASRYKKGWLFRKRSREERRGKIARGAVI